MIKYTLETPLNWYDMIFEISIPKSVRRSKDVDK